MEKQEGVLFYGRLYLAASFSLSTVYQTLSLSLFLCVCVCTCVCVACIDPRKIHAFLNDVSQPHGSRHRARQLPPIPPLSHPNGIPFAYPIPILPYLLLRIKGVYCSSSFFLFLLFVPYTFFFFFLFVNKPTPRSHSN